MSSFSAPKAAKDEGIGSVSKLSEQNCTYTWTIVGYSVVCSPRKNFRSPAFTADGDDFKWCLEHKIIKSDSGHDEVYLILLPASDADFKKYSPLCGILKASVIQSPGSSYRAEEQRSFTLSYSATSFELFLCDLYVSKNLATGDILHIKCNLKYWKTILSSKYSLSLELERVRMNKHYSDVSFYVKGKKFPAHRVILATRSSVFDAMFKNNTQEGPEYYITIANIDQEVFEEILHYIYTGKVNCLDVLADEYLAVAEKYDLKDLKMMCEQALSKKLSIHNAGETLILADMHNAEVLKADTIQYIKRNYARYTSDSELWKSLPSYSTHCKLRRELMNAISERKEAK